MTHPTTERIEYWVQEAAGGHYPTSDEQIAMLRYCLDLAAHNALTALREALAPEFLGDSGVSDTSGESDGAK